MDPIALHLEIRNALSAADELGRYEHALGNDDLAGHLAALRTALDDLERIAGRTHEDAGAPPGEVLGSLERSIAFLTSRRDEIPSLLRPRFGALVAYGERILYAHRHPWGRVPSKPLLGVLPLARVIPMDLHSVADYLCAGSYALSARLARTRRGRFVGIALGASVGGASLATDYRLSLVKAIPIEVHEVLDHVSGLSAISMPFLLGYAKRDPLASFVQIATGLVACVASLFTDYRASKGRTWPRRWRGGPELLAPRDDRPRVPEAQRPLEGLSSAPTDWQPDGEWPTSR